MKDMLEILRERKIVLVGIVLLILVFAAWSIWQYVNRQAAIEWQEQLAAVQQEDEYMQDEENTGVAVNLTDRQKKIIKGYSDAQREFIALLSANVWMDNSETVSISFREDTYTESKGGEHKTVPYAIAVVTQDNIQGEGSTYESYIAAVETDIGTFILKAQRWITADGKTGKWTLKSTGFSLAKEYTCSKAATGFRLDDVDEEAALLFGGRDALASAVSEYVTVAYPTAAQATWDGKVEVDWKEKISKTSFYLDTKSSTRITALCYMDTGEIEVS